MHKKINWQSKIENIIDFINIILDLIRHNLSEFNSYEIDLCE